MSASDQEAAWNAVLRQEATVAEEERRLVQVRRHYNSFPTINRRVPPEILSRILYLLVECHESKSWDEVFDEEDVQPSETARGIGAWIAYTHVCHHWREISLSFSAMWSFIFIGKAMHSIDAIEELIRRSRHCVLRVTIASVLDDEALACTEVLLGELHRIASLEYAPKVDHYASSIAQSFSAGAPVLRCLKLRGNAALLCSSRSGPHLPALTHLCYSGLSSTGSALLAATLTHLTLYFINDSMAWLLRALQQVPKLQYLLIVLDEDVRDSEKLKAVHLPYLRDLRAHCSWDSEQLADLFAHVLIPHTTRMLARASEYDDETFGPVISFFRKKLENLNLKGRSYEDSGGSWPSLVLYTHFKSAEMCWQWILWSPHTELDSPLDSIHSCDNYDADFPFISLTREDDEPDVLMNLRAMTTQVYPEVRTLFCDNSLFLCKDWRGLLNNLETLCVNAWRLFPEQFNFFVEASDATASAVPGCLPNLKTLVLGGDRVDSVSEDRDWQLWWKAIHTTLLARQQAHLRIRHLILVTESNQTFEPAMLTLWLNVVVSLKDVVDEVTECNTADEVRLAMKGLCPVSFADMLCSNTELES